RLTPPLQSRVGLALEKSLHGFFQGLQNRYAILHAAKSPSMARHCLASNKKTFPELALEKSFPGFF
ncbi:MAG: hypothetical protein IKN90_09545, partial [Treponema sp.]|nr:hypothetical protein [Treponema sp.]